MRAPPRPWRQIPALAASHLCHEWILTLCLVVALAAVISPLLVLLGLKYGTIQTLRERLVEDPVFREIRPTQTREFAPPWFDEVSSWPGVAFLTPTILPLSSVIHVVPRDGGKNGLFDLIPTAPGDPLLLENGAPVPVEGEAVVTAEAAKRSGCQAGGEMTVRVSRSRGGRSEQVEARLKVVSVLDPRAGSLARVYAPLSFVLDVEAYKEGYGAPGRGWAGQTPDPYASFDGAVLLLSEPLFPIARTGLIINTGFGRIAEMSGETVHELFGFLPPGGFAAYDLSAPGASITTSNLQAVGQKLRGRDRVLLPYVRGIELMLQGQALHPIGLSLDADQGALLQVEPLPWGGSRGNLPQDGRLLQVLAPASQAPAKGGTVAASFTGMEGELAFKLHLSGSTSLARPVVPVELLGILRTATQRKVLFDPNTERFQMARGGYRGFRLYARSIDDVPALYEKLKTQGVEVMAEVEAIERIRTLDRGLSRLFWLISLLSLFGGTSVLVSSLYAAVERRRRDLGVLRLLGFARRHVFFFPVAQGLIISALGLAAGFAGYGILALAINRAFASELAPGEAFCFLPASYIPLFSMATIFLAALASLVAAWRATCIDPAEVIREQ
ncbi:MAG: FtsX-like permease family protein [Desulfuromonadaceae bacterium]|nr:FtsX-like permease family protein [Desulfuromonadaceae bacterium]